MIICLFDVTVGLQRIGVTQPCLTHCRTFHIDRKRKVEGEEKAGLDDCPLLHIQAFKDLPVPVDSPTLEVTDEMRALWTVSQSNNSSPDSDEIWETYGVIGDAKSDSSDVDHDVDAPSPAFEPMVQQHVPPAPPTPVVQRPTNDGSHTLQFQYDLESEVCKAMKQGTMTEWIVVELKSICRMHSLSVRGTKPELLARVTAHFSQLYP